MGRKYDRHQVPEIGEHLNPNYPLKGFIAVAKQALPINSPVRKLEKRCGFDRILCHVNEGLNIYNLIHGTEIEVV